MWTVITGASSGIGEELSRRFAARGESLVLIARRVERLDALAEELRGQHGVDVLVVPADLADPDAPARIESELATAGVEVSSLINNAGFGTYGDLLGADPQRLADEVQVNCAAVVGLTVRLLPQIVDRGDGCIVMLSSVAAFQPLPHMAVYGATKAFVRSFGEALWGELHGTGVRVLTVCPGPTSTEFFEVTGDSAAFGRIRTVEQLVDNIMNTLDNSSTPTFIDGLLNRITSELGSRFVPRRLLITIAGRVMKG
ncbi:SDR family oxidoreductase [Gordonia jinhuaensis]|uniref:Ketoacyl reductase n=1 Tax=Gordonia jinhuaensis TaxID=1517702 RepID=A0A916WXJ0_9ACTN|nr:SDR family oxidoreductase [Gordonia jinhuaensis]GGB37526.1 ketoacyl reductase [Gordonia jinhuaensis]